MGAKANLILGIATALAGTDGLADQDMRAAKVDTLPAIDGYADDAAWAAAESIVVRDAVAEIAGRKPNPRLEQPEFGSGEIGEHIRLTFD